MLGLLIERSHHPTKLKRERNNSWECLENSGLQPGVAMRKHLSSIKTKYESRLNLEPALILAPNEDSSTN
jgi:hypothetical protein